MKNKNTKMLVLGAMALGLSTAGSAAVVTDTRDASNSGPGTTYWTPTVAQKISSPYYRGRGQDWGWEHNAYNGFSSASLSVSAYDVDHPGELDEIYGWNTSLNAGLGDWDLIGSLDGANNIFSFTTFNLGASWFDEISLGLRIMMKIDENNQGWYVSLGKSVLSLDGGSIGNPNPGSEVPIPAAAVLFAPAFLGLIGFRRKAKNS